MLKVLEDKITSLPWLEDAKKKKTEIDDKQAESNPGAKPAFKPYVSGEFLQHLDWHKWAWKCEAVEEILNTIRHLSVTFLFSKGLARKLI